MVLIYQRVNKPPDRNIRVLERTDARCVVKRVVASVVGESL